jgi:hypothetical protein
MFYKALGYAVWKMAVAYMRQRYARQAKVGAALILASIVAVVYMAKRSTEE